MESLTLAEAEAELMAAAIQLDHLLETFVVWRGENTVGTVKRSVCVRCGMVWVLHWRPSYVWGVAKIEQANRRRSRDAEGDRPEPVSLEFHCLPPRCVEVRAAEYGIWSFSLEKSLRQPAA